MAKAASVQTQFFMFQEELTKWDKNDLCGETIPYPERGMGLHTIKHQPSGSKIASIWVDPQGNFLELVYPAPRLH